jgi:micrococcal nuclease
MHRFVILLFLLIAAGPAWPAPLTPGGSGRVTVIVDGDTLIFEDGREVRLVGIQAPKLPLGRRNFKTWPLAARAKAALGALTLGKILTLSYGGRRIDRYNRLLAHLYDGDGRWIQGELLRGGMARVYSFADNRAVVAEMLALEREARAVRRGIWRNRFYRIRDAADSARDIGGFQLVEGQVHAVAPRRKRTYINFSADWRSDFTIVVAARARRLFRAAGFDLAGLEGRRIRVRGWVKSYNGPMIEATHPEQIEIID